MDKEKRRKILWVIAIIILLLAFLLWIFRTSDQNPPNINGNTNENQPTFTPPSVKLEYQTPDKIEESATEFSAVNLAKTYAARFGSWSTDNQGRNLSELIPLSTSNMKNYLSSIQLDYSDQPFRGVTTKSISAEIIDISDSSAQVSVNTQKIETNDKLERSTFYQEATVDMVKVNDIWLVDKFTWH